VSVELQEAEGRVKAARQVEADAAANAAVVISAAQEAAEGATRAREQAEAEYEAIYERHVTSLANMRERVFTTVCEQTPQQVAASYVDAME